MASTVEWLEPDFADDLLEACDGLGQAVVAPDDPAALPEFEPGEDCMGCLRDLQRFLRRDDPTERRAFLTLCKWRVPQTKLVPMAMACVHDRPLLFQLTKLLVMITMPPEPHSKHLPLQRDFLAAVGLAFVQRDVIASFLAMLADPLSRTGSDRTESDSRIIELALALFRNLLAIANVPPGPGDTRPLPQHAVHQSLLHRLMDDMALAAVLHLGARVVEPENGDWDLLIMEIFYLVLHQQDPRKVVAQSAEASGPVGTHGAPAKRAPVPPAADPLASALARERVERGVHTMARNARHSRFGGVLSVAQGGRRQFVRDVFTDPAATLPQKEMQRRTRRRDPGKVVTLQDTVRSVSASSAGQERRLLQGLHALCGDFMSQVFPPLMLSVKEALRQQSSRLVPSDTRQFLYLVWFACCHQRQRIEAARKAHKRRTPGGDAGDASADADAGGLGGLAVVMDLFVFQFVAKCASMVVEPEFRAVADADQSALAVAALKELLLVLSLLRGSRDEATRDLADSIVATVLYERDVLEALPKLLRAFDLHNVTREFLADLASLTHVVMQFIESGEDGTLVVLSRRRQVVRRKKVAAPPQPQAAQTQQSQPAQPAQPPDAAERLAQPPDAAERLAQPPDAAERPASGGDAEHPSVAAGADAAARAAPSGEAAAAPDAARGSAPAVAGEEEGEYAERQWGAEVERFEQEFTLEQYVAEFARSNPIIRAYCHLLQHYNINTPRTNQHLLQFFRRVAAHKVDGQPMECALFHLSVLVAFSRLLSDPLCARCPALTALVEFGKRLTRHFLRAARGNPMWFVEALFWRRPRESASIMRHYLEPESARAAGRRGRAADGDEEPELDGGAGGAQAAGGGEGRKRQRKKKRRGGPRGPKWTEAEDAELQREYERLCELPAVFYLLSTNAVLSEAERTEQQIARRIQRLKLVSAMRAKGLQPVPLSGAADWSDGEEAGGSAEAGGGAHAAAAAGDGGMAGRDGDSDSSAADSSDESSEGMLSDADDDAGTQPAADAAPTGSAPADAGATGAGAVAPSQVDMTLRAQSAQHSAKRAVTSAADAEAANALLVWAACKAEEVAALRELAEGGPDGEGAAEEDVSAGASAAAAEFELPVSRQELSRQMLTALRALGFRPVSMRAAAPEEGEAPERDLWRLPRMLPAAGLRALAAAVRTGSSAGLRAKTGQSDAAAPEEPGGGGAAEMALDVEWGAGATASEQPTQLQLAAHFLPAPASPPHRALRADAALAASPAHPAPTAGAAAALHVLASTPSARPRPSQGPRSSQRRLRRALAGDSDEEDEDDDEPVVGDTGAQAAAAVSAGEDSDAAVDDAAAALLARVRENAARLAQALDGSPKRPASPAEHAPNAKRRRRLLALDSDDE